MILVILGIFVVALLAYYLLLSRRSDWRAEPLQKKLELFIAPLPIAVGLLGVLMGYQATNRASLVAEQGFERDNIAQVRRTVESATSVYTQLLVAIESAYADTVLLESSLSDEDPPTMDVLRLNVFNRILQIDNALQNIALDPFANYCYRKRWKRSPDTLRTIQIHDYFGDVVPDSEGDFLRIGSVLRIASHHMKGRTSQDLSLLFELANYATRESLYENGLRDRSFPSFVFLGNLISHRTGPFVLYGTAMLADLITTIPDKDAIEICLMGYFIDPVLQETSTEYDPVSDPQDSTPTLFRTVERVESGDFSYIFFAE